MEADPDELTNLAVDPDYLETLLELRKQAVQEFRKGDGEFLDFLPSPITTSLH